MAEVENEMQVKKKYRVAISFTTEVEASGDADAIRQAMWNCPQTDPTVRKLSATVIAVWSPKSEVGQVHELGGGLTHALPAEPSPEIPQPAPESKEIPF